MIRIIDHTETLTPEEKESLGAPVPTPVDADETEFIVLLEWKIPDRAFRKHAMDARREHSKDPEKSILLVVALEDRHAEIATAPQFAGIFTESASAALLKRTLVPLMKQARVSDGIRAALEGIDGARKGGKVEAEDAEIPVSSRVAKRVGYFVFALLSIVIIFSGPIRSCQSDYSRCPKCGVLFSGPISYLSDYHRCPKCGECGSTETRVIRDATYTSSGKMLSIFTCPKCGYRSETTGTIPRRSMRSDNSNSSYSDNSSSSSDNSSGSSSSDGGGGADW